jgi:AcrR family transcriptional regulator
MGRMASRSESSDPRAARVREQMKGAALELIHERRIEKISVTDIVERAGVSRQAFYQHFTDRDDAVATAVIDSIAVAARPVKGFHLSTLDRILRLMAYVAENAELYRNLYPGVASQRSAATFRDELRPPCETLAREAHRRLGDKADIPVAALTTFLLGGLMEILVSWSAHPTSIPPRDQAGALLTAFTALLPGTGRGEPEGQV